MKAKIELHVFILPNCTIIQYHKTHEVLKMHILFTPFKYFIVRRQIRMEGKKKHYSYSRNLLLGYTLVLI
jgi:hypothetical protein